jgi:hypothetical protein
MKRLLLLTLLLTLPTLGQDLRLVPIDPGTAANGWRPAVYLKPTAAQNQQGLYVDSLLISGFSDQDGLKIVCNDQGRSYSGVSIAEVEIVRGYVTAAGRAAQLHVDCLQVMNTGPAAKSIPLSLRSVRLTKASPGLPEGATSINDAGIFQGQFSVVTLDNVRADSSLKFGEVNGSSKIPQIRVSNSPGLKIYCFKGVGAVMLSSSPGAHVVGLDGGAPQVYVMDDELAPLRNRNKVLEDRGRALEKWVGEMPK